MPSRAKAAGASKLSSLRRLSRRLRGESLGQEWHRLDRVSVSFVKRHWTFLVPLVPALLLMGGCSPISDAESNQAKVVIEQLAARDANVANPTGDVSCEEPREHMLDEEGYPSVFRTTCSVYFDDGGAEVRFKDMICIGDFELSPVAEKCYVWAPYYPDGVPPES